MYLVLALIIVLSLLQISPATYNTTTKRDETSLVTPQRPWVVIESCTSADNEATALAVDERTYILALAAQDACSTQTSVEDGEIEFYYIPQWVNGLRFRAIGIAEGGTYTVNIRAGTLGTGRDPGLAAELGTDSDTGLIGTLAFVVGTQASTTTDYELADAVIRIFDLAQALNLPLPEAIMEKHRYNSTRPYKHGKSF